MRIFSYLYKRLRSAFFSRSQRVVNNLDTIFGEDKTPAVDPNQGTSFWTVTNNSRLKQRIIYLTLLAVVIGVIFIVQLWQLQVRQGAALAIESVQNTLSQTLLFPERGTITDRTGTSLAWNTATTSKNFSTRSYATSSGFGHLLGYVTYPKQDDNGNFFQQRTEGKAGAEYYFQEELSGAVGTKVSESNALGGVVSESVVDLPEDGDDIQLSIDAVVQEKLFSLIERTARERRFAAGASVIMEIDTGKILAATDYPEYNPNALAGGKDGYIQELQADYSEPFLNRVSAGRYTPGSVIKPFMAVAALAEGVITPQTTIVSTGALRVENPYQPGTYSIFPDWKEHGPVTVRDALAVSSNEFFYQIGGGHKSQPGLGIDNIAAYSRAFGLGEETGVIGLPEVEGVIPTPAWKRANFNDDIWRLGDTYNTAIGQYGYQVTPLSMVRAVAGIASGGQLPTPTVLADAPAVVEPVARSIDFDSYQVVREGMRQAVTDGTAGGLKVDYVSIAAKTGTAELGGKDSGLNSWVIGFWPYDEPRYAFTVVMADGPRSNVVGGVYVMRRLLDWLHRQEPNYLTAQPKSNQ